jgi:integrase/recombinase XerD
MARPAVNSRRRLYFTGDERKAFLAAEGGLRGIQFAGWDPEVPRGVRSFCTVLHYTGCQISEAMALTQKSVDLAARVIVFESLKKCRQGFK